ncbi:hypothetical protein TorRG33x02_058190 [Trema orientale]|uniref:Uncharacterized protein n=1 Tax=Trema orientale TaxID=63057 RepID=A0A2P5FLA5_TREOI|nr:hypothetical protein TorRG33x02_058190 [Trema orientale]
MFYLDFFKDYGYKFSYPPSLFTMILSCGEKKLRSSNRRDSRKEFEKRQRAKFHSFPSVGVLGFALAKTLP